MDHGINTGLEEIGCIGVIWNQLAQYKFQWETVVNKITKFFDVQKASCVTTN